VAVQRDHVGVVDVGVRAGLAVAGKRFLQRFSGGRGAQPGIAVDVVGADRPVCDHCQRVVLLQEQLPGGVEAQRARALFPEQFLAALHYPVHCGLPVSFHQPVAVSDQRSSEAV
jgi:hypothetical protein